jgi:2-methylfumaryl-CoA isomerase
VATINWCQFKFVCCQGKSSRPTAANPFASVDHPAYKQSMAARLERETVSEAEIPPAPAQALSGLRVVEGSAFVAAPLGGMTLAQMGADVIRFDPLGGGLDYGRWPVTQDGRSLFWAGLNKGKRSIAIDLARPEGVEIATALICAPGPDAGLFLTNFPARGWLDYERLRERRNDLVMVNITGHHDGTTAVDYTVNAGVGFPMVTGPTDVDTVVNHVLPAWDAVCGAWAAAGLLAAERHRRMTGAGQLVTLALSDVAMAVTAALGIIAEVSVNDSDRPRYGNDLFGAFGRDFETADRRRVIMIAITTRQWSAILDATGLGDDMEALSDRLGKDLRDQGERFAAREEIAALIAPWVKARPLAEVVERLEEASACWGPYRSFRQMVEDDPRCSTANPMFSVVDQPGIGAYLTPGTPFDFGALDRVPARPAPHLGADTDAVLAEILGLPEHEIGRLHDASIVESPGKDS